MLQAKFSVLDETQPSAEVVLLKPFCNYMKQHVKICQDGIKALTTCGEDLKVVRANIRSKAGVHDDRLQAIDVGKKLLESLVDDVLHAIACAEQIDDEAQAKQHNDTLEKFVQELVSCKDSVVEISSKCKSYLQSL
jgi:hypothetical protein